jgi:hypothetical protein
MMKVRQRQVDRVSESSHPPLESGRASSGQTVSTPVVPLRAHRACRLGATDVRKATKGPSFRARSRPAPTWQASACQSPRPRRRGPAGRSRVFLNRSPLGQSAITGTWLSISAIGRCFISPARSLRRSRTTGYSQKGSHPLWPAIASWLVTTGDAAHLIGTPKRRVPSARSRGRALCGRASRPATLLVPRRTTP